MEYHLTHHDIRLTFAEAKLIRRDTGFLAFSFPRSLGSGVYDEINGGQQELVCTYLSYISTKFGAIWMSFGEQNTVPNPYPCTHGFGMVFCLCVH